MDKLPKNFCVAPFLQCTTHPSKSFSPCPYLGGTTWGSSDRGILQQWRSEELQSLRQQFLENQQPKACERCWHEERNDKRSLRKRLFDPLTLTSDFAVLNEANSGSRIKEAITTESYLSGPEILTIKNGNVCNARCRTCHPGDSSRWISDAEKLNQALGKTYYATNQRETNWADDQLQEILHLSVNLKRLELFGGEPAYNKQVQRLLSEIVESGHSKHIVLYINTNGSVDIAEKWPFITEFQQVEIGVSIDGIGSHFDYIRKGLDYDTVHRNIKVWQDFFKKHAMIYSIDAITTVSTFNVLYLPEIKSAVKQYLPLAPFWNLLVEPAHLFIKNMPDHVKLAVIEKLCGDEEFNDLINVINQPQDDVAWQRFLTITDALDQIRHERFSKTFPELSELIYRAPV